VSIKSSSQHQMRSVWRPPLVSIGALFVLFLSAVAVRHSPFAEAGRPVMIALSAIAAAVIALYGAMMIVQGRIRGIAGVVAGCIMLVLGLYTGNHVLR